MLYICIYTYPYIYMIIHIYRYLQCYIYVYINIHTFICIYIHINVCIFIYNAICMYTDAYSGGGAKGVIPPLGLSGGGNTPPPKLQPQMETAHFPRH